MGEVEEQTTSCSVMVAEVLDKTIDLMMVLTCCSFLGCGFCHVEWSQTIVDYLMGLLVLAALAVEGRRQCVTIERRRGVGGWRRERERAISIEVGLPLSTLESVKKVLAKWREQEYAL